MKVLFNTFSFMLLFVGCSAPDPKETFGSFYRSIPNTTNRVQSLADTDKPKPTIQIPSDITTLRALLPAEKFVQLEVTDRSIVGDISGVLKIDGHYIVHDRIQNQVLKFSERGAYEGPIGQAGEGPTEYLKVSMITEVYDHQIAITDGMRGQILVYDLEGHLVRKTAPPGSSGDGGKFPISIAFVWNQPDWFYLADFSAYSGSVPLHVALDYRTPEGKLRFGFGKRFAPYEQWVAQGKASRQNFFGTFREIKGRIWVANPMFAEIQIYEKDGTHFRTVHGAHPDNITEDDYLNVKPSVEAFQMMRIHKMSNFALVAVKDLVFQFTTKAGEFTVNVYDQNGNLLRSRLKTDLLTLLAMNGYDDTLVCGIPLLEKTEYYERNMTSDEMALLLASGWKAEMHEEANPMLCVRKAAW